VPSGRHRPSDQQRGHLLPDETYCSMAEDEPRSPRRIKGGTVWLRQPPPRCALDRAVPRAVVSVERSTLAREPTPPRPTPDQPAPDSPSLGRPPLPTGGLRARGGRRADETSVRHGLPPTTMQVHSLASRPVSSGWSHLRLSHARTRILPPPSRVSARAFARGSRPRAAWPRPAACRR
jgi:hypothetical protein